MNRKRTQTIGNTDRNNQTLMENAGISTKNAGNTDENASTTDKICGKTRTEKPRSTDKSCGNN